MAQGGFTLADRLGAKSVPCRVQGCTRTWLQLSNRALSLGAPDGAADEATAGMCEPCRTKSPSLKDVDRHCDRPGCDGVWTWSAKAQLEAFAARRGAPRALCAACETRLAALEDKQVPCAVPGCSRQALLTRRAQLLQSGAPEPQQEQEATAAATGPQGVTLTGHLCSPCEQVARKLKDRSVSCGITGCTRKWIWRADEQIQAFAAGKTSDPPRRMCDECRSEFGKLTDREVRCRTSGCKKVWIWTRSDQLDACVAGKPTPKAPSKMCESCFQIWSALRDVERPCRRSSCKGTWSDKRGAQLARAVRGKTGDPYPRYCTACEQEVGELADREIACKTDNCAGTWTWSREQQLAAGVRPKIMEPATKTATEPALDEANGAASVEAAANPSAGEAAEAPSVAAAGNVGPSPGGKRKKRRRDPQPPERRCSACAEFLSGRKTQEIPCTHCGTPIYWPPESQLQTHLGNWAAPGLCGACKRDVTEAARKAEREALRHPVVAVAPEPVAPPEPPPSDA